MLAGGTAIDVPFFDRYAVNAQRALDQLATLCASDPACRRAFPGWERQFGELVKAWNAHPEHGMTGDELASVVHVMLLDGTKAVSIPLVVSSAAKGDFAPLERTGSSDLNPTLVWSAPTLLTLNPIGAPIAHAGLHTSAVLHSYETETFLPPHR